MHIVGLLFAGRALVISASILFIYLFLVQAARSDSLEADFIQEVNSSTQTERKLTQLWP